jgi:hypothetical protein
LSPGTMISPDTFPARPVVIVNVFCACDIFIPIL